MDRLKNLFICSLSHDPWAAPDSSPTSPVEEQYGVDIHTFIDFISLKTLSIYLESRWIQHIFQAGKIETIDYKH